MIAIQGLFKVYGGQRVLHDVNLEVAAGETVAVLGPNGAGKTTLVEILEGFRAPSGGTVRVLGACPSPGDGRSGVGGGLARRFGTSRSRAWRDRIGVLLQTTSVEPQLTVREALEMYRALYSRPRPVAELLELVDLGAVADRRAGTLSGGQQRRLDLALALVGRPEVLFLDEPTTGFDPHARRLTWDLIRSLGCTVLLTTHYLDEAAHLADRVVVIAGGRVVAEGDPATLGGHHLATATISYRDRGQEAATVIETDRPTAVLAELTGRAAAVGVELDGLTVSRPTLEDVYLSLTGAVHD